MIYIYIYIVFKLLLKHKIGLQRTNPVYQTTSKSKLPENTVVINLCPILTFLSGGLN